MTAAQAIAAGLGIDEESRKRGYADARSRAPWRCPEHCDLLGYSLGYADGVAETRCCGGERAQPEVRQ